MIRSKPTVLRALHYLLLLAMALVFADIIDRCINRNTVQPGIELLVIVIAPDVLRHFDKDVLRYVGRLVVVIDHPVSQRRHLTAVLIYKFREREPVAPLYLGNQFFHFTFIFVIGGILAGIRFCGSSLFHSS